MRKDMFGFKDKPICTKVEAKSLGGRPWTDKQYKKHPGFGDHIPNKSLVGLRVSRLDTNPVGCWAKAGISLPWE